MNIQLLRGFISIFISRNYSFPLGTKILNYLERLQIFHQKFNILYMNFYLVLVYKN